MPTVLVSRLHLSAPDLRPHSGQSPRSIFPLDRAAVTGGQALRDFIPLEFFSWPPHSQEHDPGTPLDGWRQRDAHATSLATGFDGYGTEPLRDGRFTYSEVQRGDLLRPCCLRLPPSGTSYVHRLRSWSHPGRLDTNPLVRSSRG
jgi:hypothetical protein